MKKSFKMILAAVITVASVSFTACGGGGNSGGGNENKFSIEELSTELKTNLSADGYVKDNIGDFSEYVGTETYRQVTTADELIVALNDAKYHYVSSLDESTNKLVQVPADGYDEETMIGSVRVIEIMDDLDLGYYTLSDEAKSYTSIVGDFSAGKTTQIQSYTMSDMFTEHGISQIKVENTSNLLVYSKNGAKLTHCGFKLTSDTNVVFRNLEFDEIWQWEDASSATVNAVGDYDAFGWAYFKIAFCGYIWIDHCTFGKSYDGQIDYSNPVYNDAGTAFRAPYGADGTNGLHISWCSFNAGSDDEDGYLYKMMAAIEEDYQNGGTNYLYYNKLRSTGATFEDILYGIAIPQKKGFLCGDSGDKYEYNLELQISFSNCKFTNLEDRIPKLRGGNAYLYNCIVDNSQYYSYRTRLQSFNAKTEVLKVNGTWNCGLVSQGILCGNGGSIKAENCRFYGIEYLLKNNDSYSDPTGKLVNGGYMLVNCSYKKTAFGAEYIGNSSDAGNAFEGANDSPSKLSTSNFSWHTDDGEQPFTVTVFDLDSLSGVLNNADYGAGTNTTFKDLFLKSNYLTEAE